MEVQEPEPHSSELRRFLDALDVAAIFLDTELKVLDWTTRARDAFALENGDVGRPLSEIQTTVRDQELARALEAAIASGNRLERAIQTKDGRSLLMTVAPLRTNGESVDRILLTFQDLTASRESELQGRRSDERLRHLIDAAVDYAIFTMTDDGKIDSWNVGAERIFGYSMSEIIGKDVAILFTPEDRAADAPARELAQTLRTGRAADERYHIRKSGERFYCSGVTTRLTGGGAGFAKIARDLTHSRRITEELETVHLRLEERVRTRTGELRAEVTQHSVAKREVTTLLHRLVAAQEAERARIARDLHDHLGQQLTVLRLTLERTQSARPDAMPVRDLISEALSLTDKIGGDVDFLGWQLRPSVLDELGLWAALPQFVRQWSANLRISAQYRASPAQGAALAKDAEVAFYRVAQEALNNIAKHAQATRVDVVLTTSDGTVTLVIEDNGIGFESGIALEQGQGFGLGGMRERAGLVGASLQIDSTPGKGTAVFLRCPVDTSHTAPEEL